MNWLQHYSGALQTIASIVLVTITAVYARLTMHLVKHTKRQAEAMESMASAEMLLEIIKYIQSEELRKARAIVRGLSPTPDYGTKWSEEELWAAFATLTSFDVAATMIEQARLDATPLVAQWAPNLLATQKACAPLIDNERAAGDPRLWLNYERLVQLVPEDARAAVHAGRATGRDKSVAPSRGERAERPLSHPEEDADRRGATT